MPHDLNAQQKMRIWHAFVDIACKRDGPLLAIYSDVKKAFLDLYGEAEEGQLDQSEPYGSETER